MASSITKIRPDGTKVLIEARVTIEWHRPKPNYEIAVCVCQPKKRTFYGVYDSNDYEYRALKIVDRAAYILAKQLEVCTKEEMMEAKMKLWESIKPTQ